VTPLEPVLLPFALIQAAAVVPDTVVMVQAAPSTFATVVGVLTGLAQIVIAIALLLVALAVIPAAWYARKIYGAIDRVLRGMHHDAQPLLRHAEGAMDNVRYVTTAVRGDVERVQLMVDEAQKRLERSTQVADERIREFNALLKVMQEEAEDLFVGTASTIRGVRAGSAKLSRSAAERAWDGEPSHDVPDAAVGPADPHA
jgi:uncharacterized protein YoxC